MTKERARLRSLLGSSTALWAGEAGVRVEPDRWSALSGAKSVDYNVALCHGACAGSALARSLSEIEAAGVPALVMVAGVALGDVQQLVEHGWVCIGALPLMIRDLGPATGAPMDSRVRGLDRTELDAARALVDEVFGVGPELALVALPRDAASKPGQSVWGGFDERGELISCVAVVTVEEIVAIWSMATAPAGRRREHGAALMSAVLADAAAAGATSSLLYASAEGEPFYRSLGYRELERWQLWSRPRWVLGRA